MRRLDRATRQAGPTDPADPSVLKLDGSHEHNTARYSSREVLSMLGLRQREVRQWLGEPGLANKRAERLRERRQQAQSSVRYSFNDVQLLRSAKELRRNDVPPRKIRAAFASLKRRLPAGNSPLALRLIGEGKKVIVRDDGGTWDAVSGQLLFDFASGHSLWPLDSAVPSAKTSGELDYESPGVPGPPPPNVLRFEDRRTRAFDSRDWYEKARELELADEPGALEAYREAVRLDPEMADAHIDLGRLLHDCGEIEEAKHHYRRAIVADATSSTARFNLGVALEDQGQHAAAVEAYLETLAQDPMYADAYYNLARLYEVQGERAAALRCLQSYRRAVRQ